MIDEKERRETRETTLQGWKVVTQGVLRPMSGDPKETSVVLLEEGTQGLIKTVDGLVVSVILWMKSSLTHHDYGVEGPSRYSERISPYRSPSISSTSTSQRPDGNEVGFEPERQAWESVRGFETNDPHQHADKTTYPASDASFPASNPEEEHIDIRHFPSPPATYQTSSRNERSGHMNFVPDIGPRHAAPRAGPSSNINPSTLHPRF